MRLAPHPFCWRTSLIDALSSYVKWRYTVFSIVFPVELGCLTCFHLLYPITKLLKIFARNLHMLLKIYYILTCVIHFKCTLLLEDIIGWHVGDGFLRLTLYSCRWSLLHVFPRHELHVPRFCITKSCNFASLIVKCKIIGHSQKLWFSFKELFIIFTFTKFQMHSFWTQCPQVNTTLQKTM